MPGPHSHFSKHVKRGMQPAGRERDMLAPLGGMFHDGFPKSEGRRSGWLCGRHGPEAVPGAFTVAEPPGEAP